MKIEKYHVPSLSDERWTEIFGQVLETLKEIAEVESPCLSYPNEGLSTAFLCKLELVAATQNSNEFIDSKLRISVGV